MDTTPYNISRHFLALTTIRRKAPRRKILAYQQKSRGECSGPLRSLGPIIPLSTVSQCFLVYPHRLRCSAPAISHNGGVTRRPRDCMHRQAAVGIWITILYGVYLYGEKCFGITVRSLRSAVPAVRKSHLQEESRDAVVACESEIVDVIPLYS